MTAELSTLFGSPARPACEENKRTLMIRFAWYRMETAAMVRILSVKEEKMCRGRMDEWTNGRWRHGGTHRFALPLARRFGVVEFLTRRPLRQILMKYVYEQVEKNWAIKMLCKILCSVQFVIRCRDFLAACTDSKQA